MEEGIHNIVPLFIHVVLMPFGCHSIEHFIKLINACWYLGLDRFEVSSQEEDPGE